jgi:hypothetical protein
VQSRQYNISLFVIYCIAGINCYANDQVIDQNIQLKTDKDDKSMVKDAAYFIIHGEKECEIYKRPGYHFGEGYFKDTIDHPRIIDMSPKKCQILTGFEHPHGTRTITFKAIDHTAVGTMDAREWELKNNDLIEYLKARLDPTAKVIASYAVNTRTSTLIYNKKHQILIRKEDKVDDQCELKTLLREHVDFDIEFYIKQSNKNDPKDAKEADQNDTKEDDAYEDLRRCEIF